MIKRVERQNEYTGEYSVQEFQFPDVLNDDGYLFMPRRNQCRMFGDFPLPKALNPAEKGRLLDLVAHIEKHTNCLMKRSSKGKVAMSDLDIIKALGLKERQGKALLNKLMANGVLGFMSFDCGDAPTLQYYMNPLYMCATKRLSANQYRMFAKYIKPHIPQYVVEAFEAQLGLVGDEQQERDEVTA